MSNKRWMVWLVGLLVGASGLTWHGLSQQRVEAESVQKKATDADVSDSPVAVACFGHVDAKHGVTSLYPSQSGRVAEVLAEENQQVKAGAVLLQLEDTVASLRVKESESDLEAARVQFCEARKLPQKHQAKVGQMQAAIEAATNRLAAARSARDSKADQYARRLINKTTLNIASNQVKEAEALLQAEKEKLVELKLHDPMSEVNGAEQEVKAREARLQQAQEALKDCGLRAPTDGKVLRVLVRPGELLGATAKEAAILFCSDGPRLIRAEVEQEYASRVKIGQEATIRDDSNDSTIWRGRVTVVSDWYTHRRSILQEPLQHNDVRTLECLIALDPQQPPLRIGQRVRVLIGNKP